MLRLKYENKGNFIAGLFLKQFRVSLGNHGTCIFDSYLLHGVFNETERNLRNVENIVGIKHGFKVLSF